MAQHPLIINNNYAAQVRAEINAAFNSIKTQQSGTNPPPNPVKYQQYVDTDNDHLYIYNGSRWVDKGNIFTN